MVAVRYSAPVAQNHAVFVRAIVVRVDGEHRAQLGCHAGDVLLAAAVFPAAKGGLELGSARELHIRHEIYDAVFFHAVDVDGVRFVHIFIVGFRHAGLRPGAFRPRRHGGRDLPLGQQHSDGPAPLRARRRYSLAVSFLAIPSLA